MNETAASSILERLLDWSLERSVPVPIQYAIGSTTIIAVGIFRALVVSAIVPWLLFIPVVLTIALLSGTRRGVHAAFLSAIVAGVSIGHANEPAWLTGEQWVGSLMFLAVACGIVVLAAELRTVFARSRILAVRNEATQAALRAVFDNAPVGLSLSGANGESVLLNGQMARLLGRDISKGDIDRYLGAGAVHDDGTDYALDEYPQVRAIRHGTETEAQPFLIRRPDGSRLRTEISSVPLRGPDGSVAGAVSVVVDVEEREQAIEHQAVLIGELAHRMKNTMAMVQAIVHQSLRSATSLTKARENVVSRFEALVRAQDLLTRAEWKSTDIGAVAQAALETVIEDGRVIIAGPCVRISARAALSLTLVLHELATNAIKYGALSVPEGNVDLHWTVEPSGREERMTLTWFETGGPAVSPPSRKGFGTRLIDTMGRTFGGSSQLSYDPSGLSWTMKADAGRLGTV